MFKDVFRQGINAVLLVAKNEFHQDNCFIMTVPICGLETLKLDLTKFLSEAE